MTRSSLRIMLLCAVAYGLLNQLWLAGGNAAWLDDNLRTIVKGVSLFVTAIVFVGSVIYIEQQFKENWFRETAVTSACAVGLGLAIILISGLLVHHDQFFHDQTVAERAPSLLLVVIAAMVASAALAGFIGLIVRAIPRRRAS